MDQDNPNTRGLGRTSASERPGTSIGPSTTKDIETCAHCGQPLNQNAGIEQFLGRIGISEEMINNLKTQMQNVDIEEYLNTARDYLRTASDKVKDGSDKATRYAKDNPGKVAAGVAVLAVGAGLLLNSLRDRD
jgi:hypothetical protein